MIDVIIALIYILCFLHRFRPKTFNYDLFRWTNIDHLRKAHIKNVIQITFIELELLLHKYIYNLYF